MSLNTTHTLGKTHATRVPSTKQSDKVRVSDLYFSYAYDALLFELSYFDSADPENTLSRECWLVRGQLLDALLAKASTVPSTVGSTFETVAELVLKHLAPDADGTNKRRDRAIQKRELVQLGNSGYLSAIIPASGWKP